MHLLKNIWLITCFCLVGCIAQKTSSQNTSKILFEKITSQSHGGFKEKQYLIIASQEELKKVYAQVNLFRKPGLPIPTIDFKKERVIALFMGQKNSGGFQIEIDSIKIKEDNSLEIKIKEIVPEGFATTVITQPFSIYRIQSKAEMTFK